MMITISLIINSVMAEAVETVETLKTLEENRRFIFVYDQRINQEFQFIRKGGKHEPINDQVFKKRIVLFDPHFYEKVLQGQESDREIDFWQNPDGCIMSKVSSGTNYHLLQTLK